MRESWLPCARGKIPSAAFAFPLGKVARCGRFAAACVLIEGEIFAAHANALDVRKAVYVGGNLAFTPTVGNRRDYNRKQHRNSGEDFNFCFGAHFFRLLSTAHSRTTSRIFLFRPWGSSDLRSRRKLSARRPQRHRADLCSIQGSFRRPHPQRGCTASAR